MAAANAADRRSADLDRGLFSISVAAELAGLHPQTLRIYEREGLLWLQIERPDGCRARDRADQRVSC
jgi:MerR family transcriptional regulator/heat shock protein HspR